MTNVQIPSEIQELLERYRLSQHYADIPLVPTRTLILIGRTRTGKSTISAVLKNSMYVPPLPRLFYGTDAPRKEQVNGLTIIDTPGFFNQNERDIAVDLSNDAIETMLDHVIKTNNASVTLFAFVFNLEAGINVDDIKTMILIRDRYPGINDQLMLILTHCEETDEIIREKRIQNFFEHEDVVKEKLSDLFKHNIFFMGCIRTQTIERNDPHAILDQYKNVLKMRNKFIEYFYSNLEQLLPIGLSHIRPRRKYKYIRKLLCVSCLLVFSPLVVSFLALYMVFMFCHECICPICNSTTKIQP